MTNQKSRLMAGVKIYRDALTNFQMTCERNVQNCDKPTLYCKNGGSSYSESCSLQRDAVDASLWQCTNGAFNCFFTFDPTKSPTSDPTKRPTISPTLQPTTKMPTQSPSNDPSAQPTTAEPSQSPSYDPSATPSA